MYRQQIDKLTTITRYEIKNEMKSIVPAITDCIKNDLPNIIQDAFLETILSIEKLSSHIHSNAESARRNKVTEKLANNKILKSIQETEETFKRNIESYQSHFAEKESRSHNIVISGIPFFGHDCFFDQIMELLHYVDPSIQPHEILNCKRIGGNLSNNCPKYVLVSCRNRATVYWLHNYGSGRRIAKGLWINPDLTKVERESRYKAKQLASSRNDSQEKDNPNNSLENNHVQHTLKINDSSPALSQMHKTSPKNYQK